MEITQKIIELKEAMLKAENIQHMNFIAEKYMGLNISLGKKKKLFFIVLLEIKEERKKTRRKYLDDKNVLTDLEKRDLLRRESTLKKQIEILKLYCEKIKLEQKKNKQLDKKIKPVLQMKTWVEEDIDYDEYIKHPKCEYYLECLIKKQPFEIDDITYCLMAYTYFIRNYNLLDYFDVIMDYNSQILSKVMSLNEEERLVRLNSIIDNIKYKKAEYKDKNNLDVKLEKDILKQIKKECSEKLINMNYKSIPHDYRGDILEYLFYQDGSYYYIKKLIEQIPELISIRLKENKYIVEKSKFIEKSIQEDEHILVKIIKLFTYNLEIELRSQDPNFINRDYYKKLYFLISSYPVNLTKEDRKEINDTLDRMLEHLKNNRYEEQRKTKALMDVTELKENINKTKKELKKVKKDQLKQEIDMITLKRETSLNDQNRVDLRSSHLKEIQRKIQPELDDQTLTLKEIASKLDIKNSDIKNSLLRSNTIMLEGKNVAYSIHHDLDYNYYLQIHVPDLTCYIDSDSMLAFELYNQIYTNEKNNISKLFNMETLEEIPVITYQFKILKNGVISNFHMFPSKISIDHIYSNEEFLNYRLDERLKSFVIIYRMINNTDKSRLSIQKFHQLFNDLIGESISPYIVQNNIPLIIRGRDDNITQDIKLYHEIRYLFTKIDYKDYKKIANILSTNRNMIHYSSNLFDANTSGENYINILDECNYEHLFNQWIIKEIIKQTSIDTIIDRYYKLSEEIVSALNDSIGYVDYVNIEIKQKNKSKKLENKKNI